MKKQIMKFFGAMHVAIYRRSHGRFGSVFGGGKALLLTTIGRKTGLRRTVPLMYFDDAGVMFVSASAAGAPEDPAWFRNLLSNPLVEVQIGPDVKTMRAEPASPAKSAALWERLCGEFPRFRAYNRSTTRAFTMVHLHDVAP